MLTIKSTIKKSSVLSPSSLPCLSKIPTINISAGCAHNCIYCYSKGYSTYPGDNTLTIYSNLLEKLSSELSRKRRLPHAAYFCPSCDPFQPVNEIMDCTYEIMNLLLTRHIGLQFVTKGIIPSRFLDLFSKSPHLISGQIGISCTDDNVRAILEPGAAAINQRLDNLKNLHSLGIDIAVRADPLIYNVTDSDTQVRELCSRISPFTSSLALSYLFLRPAIRQSIERLPDKSLVSQILEPYRNACRLKIGPGSSQALALPAHIRSHAFDRIKKIANEFGITTHPCSCKNHDITSDYCRISKPTCSSSPTLF